MLPNSQPQITSFSWDAYSHSIIENVNVWLNVYDKDLNLVFWNAVAEKISGYSRDEVLGHSMVWEWLYPDETYRKFIILRAADLLVGEATIEDWETQILCRNNEVKTIAWNSQAVYDDSDQFQGAITFGYDVTSRKNAEDALKKAHDELSVLLNVASVTSGSIDLDVILRRSLEQVLPIMKSAKGLIHLWQEDAQELHLAAYKGLPDPSVTELLALTIEKGIIGRVFQEEVPISIPNLITELDDAPANVPHRLFHAYLGVPMKAKGHVCGVFSVLGKAEQQFTVDEITLLTSIADQIGVAVENARLYQQSRQLAVSEERRRLARELHDAVTQSLYSLTLFAEAGHRSLQSGDLEDASIYLTELGTTAQSALREMRLLLHELRPLVLESEGLLEAVQRRLDAVERRVGIKARLKGSPQLQLPPHIEQELYRIIQEALNNTLRHAAAQRVSVTIQQIEEMLAVEIADNGVGFDPEIVRNQGGIGLESMRERAKELGGELQIYSALGEGTTTTIKLQL
jgi:PAS domain S-box-containing protein